MDFDALDQTIDFFCNLTPEALQSILVTLNLHKEEHERIPLYQRRSNRLLPVIVNLANKYLYEIVIHGKGPFCTPNAVERLEKPAVLRNKMQVFDEHQGLLEEPFIRYLRYFALEEFTKEKSLCDNLDVKPLRQSLYREYNFKPTFILSLELISIFLNEIEKELEEYLLSINRKQSFLTRIPYFGQIKLFDLPFVTENCFFCDYNIGFPNLLTGNVKLLGFPPRNFVTYQDEDHYYGQVENSQTPSYYSNSRPNRCEQNNISYENMPQFINRPNQQVQNVSFTPQHPQHAMMGPCYSKRGGLRGGKSCSFCRKNGELPLVYETHSLKGVNGDIICPILSKHHCEICGATGNYAHTKKYCPFNNENPVDLPKFRLLANGTISDSHYHK